jgi:hypothetical protein
VLIIVHTGAVEAGGSWAKKFAVILSRCSLIYRLSSLHSIVHRYFTSRFAVLVQAAKYIVQLALSGGTVEAFNVLAQYLYLVFLASSQQSTTNK